MQIAVTMYKVLADVFLRARNGFLFKKHTIVYGPILKWRNELHYILAVEFAEIPWQ